MADPALLLLVAPAWAVVLWASLRRPRRPGACVRAALGCAAVGLLLLALAGPSLRVARTGDADVVILYDATPSMAAAGADTDSGRTLAPWTAALPDRRTQVIPYAADETDLAAGLRRAAAALPEGQGLVVLYTDARQGRGDAGAEAARLAAAGIGVHAIRPALAVRDVALAGIDPPASPPPDRPLDLTVRLAATLRTEVRLRLTRAASGDEGQRAWDRRVAVSPDAGAVVSFRDGPLPAGRYRYDVALTADDDACPENNRGRCTVAVGGVRDVCYVHTGPAPGPLAGVLRRAAPAGLRLTPRSVSAGPVPTDVAVVVLENLPAWVLGRSPAERLARAVTDGGLGLWVAGGDDAFAAGAYGDSPLEPLLPVSSRPAERPALHLALVLDASGSMNETVGSTQKLALAKRAVLTLRPALADGDRIGVVAFAGQPAVVAPMGPLAEWDALRRRLLAMEAGGGTRITPAVRTAIDMFPAGGPPAGAQVIRHVLVLSDGRSEDFGVDALVRAARSRGVSISAVATGEGAREDLLGRLASETGGRLYADADPARLAEVFLKEMIRARGEGLRDGPWAARWVRPAPVWPAAGMPLPTVPACNATQAKDDADVHWSAVPSAAGGDAWPLLATWRRGLGKVAAMPWPAGTAPEAWLTGPAAEGRLAALLGWLARAEAPATWSAHLRREGTDWTVRVREDASAIGSDARPFVAAVLPEDGDPPPPVVLTQVAPGVHEASLPGLGTAGGTVAVHRRGGRPRQRLSVPVLPPAELVHLGVDADRLEAIVRAAGGRIHDTPASLAEMVRGKEMRTYRPMDRPLLWAAGAVLLALAGLRILGKA